MEQVNKNVTRMIIIGGVIVLGITGFFVYKRSKKRIGSKNSSIKEKCEEQAKIGRINMADCLKGK